MKKAFFKSMMCAGTVSILLAGCAQENVYDPNAVTKKYENAWEKNFGKIDPNQTWNTAARVTANIDLSDITSEECQVRIYTANPIGNNSSLLAQKQIKGNGKIDFDIPQALDYAFVEAENQHGKAINGYYLLNGNIINVNENTKTRAEESCTASISTSYERTYSGWNNEEQRNYSFTHQFAHLSNIEIKEGDTWAAKDWLQIVGENGVFKEYENNLVKWKDRLGSRVEYITATEGPVELSLNFGATQNRYNIGYFYYREGEDINAATRYVLFQNYNPNDYIKINGNPMSGDGMNLAYIGDGYSYKVQLDDKITGSKVKLVYNNNGTLSYTFPSGIHLAFFVSKSNEKNIDINNIWNSIEYADGYNTYLREGNTQIHTCAVTYRYRNQIILGIEDGSDWDMNDLLCFVSGNFTEKPDDIADPTPEANQSWLLACEDLGNTDDFDFNDIVFSVSHVAGTTEATVTPLAAGGTLEAHIYYGNQDLGEIHQLLGQNGFTITNTNDSKGTAGEAQKITVPENFSMADNMGGFKVVIKSNEKEMVTINAPQNGTAPQMICIDNSTNWAWPTERTNISEAYPDFGEWGANYNTNPEWYKKSVDGKIVK